jgi:hypothetical protein
MDNSKKSYVGYHGTTYDRSVDIINNGFDLSVSYSDEHWLGQGVYVYEMFELAKWWADAKSNDKNTGCVLLVKYQAEQNNICDLTLPYHYDLLTEYYQNWRKSLADLVPGKRIVFKNERQKRCALFDCFKEQYNFKILIYYFPREKAGYLKHISSKTSKGLKELNITYNEKQICISDINCIYSISKEEL